MIFSLKKQSPLIHRILFWGGKRWVKIALLTSIAILLQVIYLSLRFEYINEVVPIFYNLPWGERQLADKHYLYLFPILCAVITGISLFLYKKAQRYYWQAADYILLVSPIAVTVILSVSLLRIIFIASTPFEPLFNPLLLVLAAPFFTALVLTLTLSPKFIELLKEKNIVTNPQIHKHPSMILKKPSARGGGAIFTLLLILTSVYYVGFTKLANSVYVGTGLLALLGLFDDYQNTNPRSKLKFLENPIIRLGSLFLLVLVPIYMGIRIDFINNPFNGVLHFDTYTITLFGNTMPWLSVLITSLWIVWVLNVLSWSNGVDGQYGGIVGIACLVIAVLALRFEVIEGYHLDVAKITAAAAGAAFGLTYFNWYPSKIMWGFGAMSAGFVIAATSILIGGKVATSTLIILIPFLDAIVIVIRRLLQKRNPFKGDRGHLHHLLMNRGWGIRRIASFYWVTTAMMGLVVLQSAGRGTILLSLTVGGLVAFFILVINFTANNTIPNRIRKALGIKIIDAENN